MRDILMYVKMAGEHKADLVVFPEAAITGLCLSDNPLTDINLGLSEDSPEIWDLCSSAKNNNLNLAIGVLERENGKLYDSALFINRNGEITLKYRRISSGWRDSNQETIYKEGSEINFLKTEFGSICFLICGDLFDEKLVSHVKDLNINILLFPFARSFCHGTDIKEKWQKEAFKEYVEQIKKSNTVTLAVNCLDEDYFGGAFALNKDGSIISYFDIGQEGMLWVDL